MLTEDDVIDAVHDYLVSRQWQVVVRATARQRGGDLVVKRGNTRLIIEAKGAGSSKTTIARYGKPFSSGQVFDYVAKAVLKALRLISAGSAQAGIALPDDDAHRKEASQVMDVLQRLGVALFWVDELSNVRVEASWEV